MQQIASLFGEREKSTARNAREDLINQIAERVERIDGKKSPSLKRRIAIAANTFKWTTQDLHYLLKKDDVKNYPAFVNWSVKIKKL